ncbi:hypothetical protein HD806DRAFT_488930 [Xylariaceae sp. AK1471]|nr:hypothetical protein HD806DRAFT_488930 [Xylariaceae sp. AK1471]
MPRTTPTDTSTSANHKRDLGSKRGAKRQSTDNNDSAPKSEVRKRARTSKSTEPEAPKEEQRPRLTTPDLEFDYDRSQLRDPRPTPGRVRRPRLEESEVTDEFKQRFFIPKPERPKGRLNAYQKDLMFKEQALLDPTKTFHDLYICHKNGPRGPPTYDSAGFRLDFNKVAEWMRPKSYSKSRVVRGMERAVDRATREQQEIFESFFVHGDEPDNNKSMVNNYVKDHISKDLGIPWHQISPKHAREWEQKGFQKKKFSEWWQEPNEEERKRMMKMMGGASLRKDL